MELKTIPGNLGETSILGLLVANLKTFVIPNGSIVRNLLFPYRTEFLLTLPP